MQNQADRETTSPARSDDKEPSALRLRILDAITGAAGADGRAHIPPDVLAESVGASVAQLRDQLWELHQQGLIAEPLETFPGDLFVLEPESGASNVP